MTLDEAIEQFKHDAECNRADLDLSFAEDNDKVAEWLEELKAYQSIGAPEELQDMKNNYFEALSDWRQYRKIGTLEECRAAVEKQKPKKPIYKHYEDEDKGEPPYIKIACPNGCRIQLYPVTDKNLAHEHVYCPKCGQKLDWGGEE